MNIIIRIAVIGLLIAACGWVWLNTPPLFWGTFLSEFQMLLPFAAIIILLTLANWVSGLLGKES